MVLILHIPGRFIGVFDRARHAAKSGNTQRMT